MKLQSILMATILGIGAMTTACEPTEGMGSSKFSSALRKVSGRIDPGAGAAKISAVVGSGNQKQQIRAIVDKATNRFSLRDLPAGTKSILIEQGGKTRTVEFAVSRANLGKLAAVIPETNLRGEELDLGLVRPDASGERMVAENNPFESLLDTDGDGTADFDDPDIDGDGVPNEEENDSLFGDYAEGWGWEDEWLLDEFDCDGNGIVDWEQPDFAAECWAEQWDDFWGDSYWESDDYYGSEDDWGYDDSGDDSGDDYVDDYGYDDSSDDDGYDDSGYDDCDCDDSGYDW